VRDEQGDTDQPIRFQGQYHDEESGLYYNRYRYYAPELGRYVSQDPIGLLGGMNGYSYPSKPTQHTDALGLVTDGGKPQLDMPDTGDIVRGVITNSRGAKPAAIGDNAFYDACTNNGRILTCMARIDEYEEGMKLDKSVGEHPFVQTAVEAARELGKYTICTMNNVCDISGYKPDKQPPIWPPAYEDLSSGKLPPMPNMKNQDKIH